MATLTRRRAPKQSVYARVTANQHVRVHCLTRPSSYVAPLRNVSRKTATWQIAFPYTPLGNRFPQWAALRPRIDGPSPTSGTIAPGGEARLVVEPQGGYPCAGMTYHATLSISVPGTHAVQTIPLTYTGIGPEPNSHLVVTQNQNYTESCVNGVAPAPPYTVLVKNTGNARAYPYMASVEKAPNNTPWADSQDNLVGVTWIGPGQVMRISMTPQAWVGCTPATYHLDLYYNTIQGNQEEIVLTDTIE
jgi:hypothetical protein